VRTGQTHLFIPGPTNVPEDVRRAMNVPMQDMRATDFGDLTLSLFTDLRTVFGTETAQVFLFPGSGTGAWEAAITNTLNPGDKVLMARHGQFSALWIQMAERLGLNVEVVDAPWGEGLPVAEFVRILGDDRYDEIKAVFVTHNETATGVTSDIAAARRALDTCFHEALLFVDGVSSIASMPFLMDEWEVDLAVTGSQKGLMCPPGLGILAVSQKAMAASETSTMRRAYFEFADMVQMNADGQFPYTPPTQLLHGLKAALARLNAEGLPNVFARHHRLAEGIRRGIAAWGLSLAAQRKDEYSDTVSAICLPDTVDARDVLRIAYDEHNASFGSGLGPLTGRVFRIGHLGDLNEGMCLTALGIAEMALYRAGVPIQLGSGTGAAQAHFAAGADVRPVLRIAAE